MISSLLSGMLTIINDPADAWAIFHARYNSPILRMIAMNASGILRAHLLLKQRYLSLNDANGVRNYRV